MNSSRIKWTAVALFAAALTVGEVFAIHAAARDARRWLGSDTAREIRQAGRTVVAMVAGSTRTRGECCTAVRIPRRAGERLRIAGAETRAALRELRHRERVRVLRTGSGI